jgi:uncharacterized protein
MKQTVISQARNSGQEDQSTLQAGTRTGLKAKPFALLEVLLVYSVFQGVVQSIRDTKVVRWEFQHLGWSYIAGFLFFLPVLIIWLRHRNWADYGVSLANWRTNLDVGIKAFVVGLIPFTFGMGSAAMLGFDYRDLGGGVVMAVFVIFSTAIMVRIMNRHKPVTSGRANLILIAGLMLVPIVMGIVMHKMSVAIVSTILWQFVFSGFGEEFLFRGYIQSHINQAFGRPYHIFGIQFGPGLFIAALLFGLMHVFNGLKPGLGLESMYWGWGLWTFFGGLFSGVIREKTGTLLAPGISHGLPDAVGEPMRILMGWV